jgi:tRNA threonylcarbamoyladenosine biosynthesis protein TsaE
MWLDIKLPDPAATEALGAALAEGARPGRVMHLRGELGAGKTTLVRGLLRALGWAGRVKSPTYALVEAYTVSSLHFYHFDLYRLENRSEWLSSGFREYFSTQAFCVVEWPEKAAGLLGAPDVDVYLQFMGEGRTAGLHAQTSAGASWLAPLRSLS